MKMKMMMMMMKKINHSPLHQAKDEYIKQGTQYGQQQQQRDNDEPMYMEQESFVGNTNNQSNSEMIQIDNQFLQDLLFVISKNDIYPIIRCQSSICIACNHICIMDCSHICVFKNCYQ